MSGDIPSFIKPLDDYHDLFPNDDLDIFGAPVDATPVSRVPSSIQGEERVHFDWKEKIWTGIRKPG